MTTPESDTISGADATSAAKSVRWAGTGGGLRRKVILFSIGVRGACCRVCHKAAV